MARHGLYGVFVGTKWAMCSNKRTALREARRMQGEVRRMPLPNTRSWDSPTFYTCSDRIADYRQFQSTTTQGRLTPNDVYPESSVR